MSSTTSSKFSGANALSLCHEVQRVESLTSPSAVEYGRLEVSLRDLAEVLVWCDKHDESACDRALDGDIMTTVERVATNALTPVSVKVRAVQFVTILLQNLTRLSSVYFVCSNNHVNRVIAMQLDEQTDDDELVSTYTSFLKTLALRLDCASLQFFFDSASLSFPLFDKATKLLMSPDAIIGAAARQVVVTIAQLQDAELTLYLKDALIGVYDSICELLQRKLLNVGEQIPWIRKGVKNATSTDHTSSSLSNITARLNLRAINADVEDALDDVYYLNDLLAVTPSASVETAVMSVVRRVLQPMRDALEREVVACSRIEHTTGTATQDRGDDVSVAAPPDFLRSMAPETIVAFVARWLSACDAGSPLAARIIELFTRASDPAHAGGTIGRVLRSSVLELHGNAVRFLHVMVERTLLDHWPVPASASSPTFAVREGALTAQPSPPSAPPPVPPPSVVVGSVMVAVRSALDAQNTQNDNNIRRTEDVPTRHIEQLEWVLEGLVSSLWASLKRPGDTRVTTVALLLQELQLILNRTLARVGQTNGQDAGLQDLWECALLVTHATLSSGCDDADRTDGALLGPDAEVERLWSRSDDWLGPAHVCGDRWEELFLAAKREDALVGSSLVALLTDVTSAARHDAVWFVPALPRFHVDDGAPSASGSALDSPTLQTWFAIRTALTNVISPFDRVSLTAAEARRGSIWTWLLLRAFLVSHMEVPSCCTASAHSPSPRLDRDKETVGDKEKRSLRERVVRMDPFVAHCARASTAVSPLQELAVDDTAELGCEDTCPARAHGLSCELVGEMRRASPAHLHIAPPGTRMQLVWGKDGMLYLVKFACSSAAVAGDNVTRDESNEHKTHTVLFALDPDFVEAAAFVSSPFKVVIGYNPAQTSEAVAVCVVLRRQITAATFVNDIMSVAKAHRRSGGELMAALCGAKCRKR